MKPAMRKAACAAILGLAAGSAAADFAKWILLEGRESFAIYFDAATIRKSANLAQMWDLSDSKSGKPLGGLKQAPSFKMEREYECGKQQVRVLYVSWHSANMGEGEIIGSDTKAGAWQPVMPGTIGEKLWKIACGTDGGRRL